MVAEVLALRLNWTVDTQNQPSLQSMKLQSGYELHLENAAGQQNETILSYQGSAQHDHLVTLEMQKASLSKETQALLPLPNLSNVSGKLLYAPDTAKAEPQTGKPCLISFSVDLLGQPGSGGRSVALYPPGPEEFKQLDRLRVIHVRSGSALVRIAANSQDGEGGPNCRNRVSIGNWEQVIGKDLEMAFVPAPDSEVTLKISAKPDSEDGFVSGRKEVESLELEPLYPVRLFVSPLGVNRAEQIRRRAGSPPMAVTNLRLGGDFLEFELSGLVGLRLSDLLGNWKWAMVAFVDVPLLIWMGKTVRRRRSRIPEAIAPLTPPTKPMKPRIFLSYSWGDRERVMQIHDLLKAAGAEPWIDREEIRGGAEWELSIKQQMRNSERVIIFLSCASTQRAGFAWAEIRMAARIAEEQPEGKPFIIPIKLDDCPLPDVLSRWNSIDLYRPDGEAKLYDALGLPQANTGKRSATTGV